MPYATLHKQVTSPLDWMVVGGMLAYTLFQLSTDTYPGAIMTFTSDGYRMAWGSMMAFGYFTALLGMSWRNHSKGLAFEAFGMYLAGGATMIYCFALLSLGKPSALLAAVSFGVIGLGCMLQGAYIHIGLRRIANGKFTMGHIHYKPVDLPELEDD